MTENITTGDILNYEGMHRHSRAGYTNATVLGIVGAVIVIAILWFAFIRNRDHRHGYDCERAKEYGGLDKMYCGYEKRLCEIEKNERADAIKIAYTDGALYGPQVKPYCYPNHYYDGCDGRHGRRDRDDSCAQRQQFREVQTFTPSTSTVEVVSTCGGRV